VYDIGKGCPRPRGGDWRGKGWEEGGKGKVREGEGGTCSKVLGGIDAPANRGGVCVGAMPLPRKKNLLLK